jgi:transposase
MEIIELRQQVNYWKTQHQRAVEREERVRRLSEQQAQTIREQANQAKELKEENEKIKAELAVIKRMLFGDKQEKQRETNQSCTESSSKNNDENQSPKRNRGQQPGTKGHGRVTHENLPTEEVFHDLGEDEKRCSICGQEHQRLNFTEDSEEVTIEIIIKRIMHRRYQYKPGCRCRDVSGPMLAEAPLKLFPKTKFSTDFWIHMLLEKFLYQRPSHRSLHHLRLEGLPLSQGTITGGFEKIQPMVIPLYAAIVEYSRAMNHWHMDETRWLVFANNDESDQTKRWWLWVMVNKEACVYVIDPTRSREVVLRHLGEDPEGIISSDRYSVYQNICEAIIFAYCWAHLRRDFIRIYDSRKKWRPWAQQWIDTIARIYQLNDQRVKYICEPKFFELADAPLRQAIDDMSDVFKKQLKDPGLHPAAIKVLKSLDERWDQYCTFVDHPEVPMDNNFAERKLRDPAVGRKNYYGSGSAWTAMLTAAMFTILQTLILHKIHPRKFLKMYFQECAKNRGDPPDNVQPFLPWNLSEEQKSTLSIDSS